MNAIIKRELKDVSHTGLKTNTPTDYFDYQYSYYLPETKAKIEKAVERMLIEIGKILDDDRNEAEKMELYMAAGLEQPVQS